jgi:hypothetical protein
MAEKYKVYPVETVNMPKLHPGITMLNYELYLGDGDVLDVRTSRHMNDEVEIKLAQIIDIEGNYVCDVPFDQIILCERYIST